MTRVILAFIILQISVQTLEMTYRVVTQVRLVHAGIVGAIVAGAEAMAVVVAGAISIDSRTLTSLVVGSFAKWQNNLTK
jgi:hypothetical protein